MKKGLKTIFGGHGLWLSPTDRRPAAHWRAAGVILAVLWTPWATSGAANAQTNTPPVPALTRNQMADFTNTHHLVTNVVWVPNVPTNHLVLGWNPPPWTNTVQVVQRTSDLRNWMDVGCLPDTASLFTNEVPSNQPIYFYRVILATYGSNTTVWVTNQ